MSHTQEHYENLKQKRRGKAKKVVFEQKRENNGLVSFDKAYLLLLLVDAINLLHILICEFLREEKDFTNLSTDGNMQTPNWLINQNRYLHPWLHTQQCKNKFITHGLRDRKEIKENKKPLECTFKGYHNRELSKLQRYCKEGLWKVKAPLRTNKQLEISRKVEFGKTSCCDLITLIMTFRWNHKT